MSESVLMKSTMNTYSLVFNGLPILIIVRHVKVLFCGFAVLRFCCEGGNLFLINVY